MSLRKEVVVTMDNYQEKRRAKRIPVELKLEISSLFRQDNEKIGNVNAPIEVLNVSRSGIGFKTENTLPLGFYFNASLHLMKQEDANLYCVVKIIREEHDESGMNTYGCEIIGFPSILGYVFDDLEASCTD